MTVIVVGAGMSGLACARELVDAGVPTRVIERGRVVGGRLASKRYDGRYADIGAAYLTADDPAFLGRLESWRVAGLAHPWTDTFRGQHGPGPMRWAAPGGLRGLAEDLARELDVTLGTEVTGMPRDTEAVVLAMPGPQALRVAADFAAAAVQEWEPVLAAVLRYPERTWDDFHGLFVNDDEVLATVCDDGDRRGDRAPVLVAHSTPAYAKKHLDDPRQAGPALAAAVARRLTAATPEISVHRWTFAQPRPVEGQFARQGDTYLCGDAFGKPRVQTAWLSGRAVTHALLGRR